MIDTDDVNPDIQDCERFINELAADPSMSKRKPDQYPDRWVGDVVIGSTGNSLCIRLTDAKKVMGLMKGETVRMIIWRAPPSNKLPVVEENAKEIPDESET